jgi:hypothetical protein
MRTPEEQGVYQRERLALERRRQMRFLMLLACVVLAASVWHAGLSRAFPPSWWRLW